MAEVRVTTKDEEPEIEVPNGPRTIRWSGTIPPQKWMLLYTKIFSKYSTSPDLKLEVSFVLRIDHDQADAKLSETKRRLRELGLDDGVSIR